MSDAPSETFPVIAFAASLGGIEALGLILRNLPEELTAAVAIVQHRSEKPGLLAEVLSRMSGRLVLDAAEGDLYGTQKVPAPSSPGCAGWPR